MAAELHALSLASDQAYVAKTIMQEILNRDVAVHGLIDSKTVFDTVTKLGPTMEKRLQIDASALRQSHLNGEQSSLAWIPGSQNVADAMTKELPPLDHPFYKLLRSNRIDVSPTGWVEQRLSNTSCKKF